MTASILIAPGARAAEERLLAELAELCREAREDPTLLALPVRIIVPSRSLRLHLGERVTATLGAVAGVTIQTLHGAAVEILERTGRPPVGGDAMVDVLARRHAHDERALSDAFGAFRDGYRTVAGSVRDLLDAGLEPEHEEPLLERIGALAMPRDERRRAEAVVCVALRVAGAVRDGHGGRSELLRRAHEALTAEPGRALPTRTLFVHGFADVTGRAGDLVEELVQRIPARVLLDHPSDPDDATRPDLGCAFTDRLRERLEGALGAAAELPRAADTPAPTLFRAPGAQAEVRAVARRVRELLDGGTAPERIGIVARDLDAYRSPLRVQLDRLGIPRSALRARAPLDGHGRRLHALVELFEQRERLSADRWLDVTGRIPVEAEVDGEPKTLERAPGARLRLGLRVVGAARLGDVAALRPEEFYEKGKDRVRLPVRTSVATARPEDTEGADRERRFAGFHAPQERLAGAELHGAARAAKSLLDRLERWPDPAPLERHLAELERLRRSGLRWKAGDRAEKRIRPALERLADALPGEQLSFAELVHLLRSALLSAAAPAFGGEGGGVQVLDAMEARARTFDHLFVLGLNRDVFPRVVREDPLLADDVRRALADVLPDVPIKARGRQEDRYLFAQLLSAGAEVTLSWQLADDDGKARVVSPLVERLLREQSDEEVHAAPPVFPQADRAGERPGPRTAREHAILAGLHAGLDGLAPLLEGALGADGVEPTASLAASRLRVLDAFEGASREPVRLAPWLGFLGPQDDVGVRPDPRVEPPYVTRLESLARCPWQTVLTRLLRLESAPDPLDALPGIDKRVLGNVVHRVLEKMTEAALGEEVRDLDAALAREPVQVSWPSAEELEELLFETTREEVRRERAPVPGLVRMFAECARPHLERARSFFADEQARFPELGVLGAEVAGEARIVRDGEPDLRLVFRADRVERRGDTVVLTDFKTGRVIEKKKRKNRVVTGRYLQPMAYAIGVDGHGLDARGRYLFLAAETDAEVEIGFGKKWVDHRDDFAAVVGAVVDAWIAGTFFPRVENAAGQEPDACKFCEVKAACLRHDSGARRAMRALAGDGGDGEPPALDATLGAPVRAVWALAGAKHEGAK